MDNTGGCARTNLGRCPRNVGGSKSVICDVGIPSFSRVDLSNSQHVPDDECNRPSLTPYITAVFLFI